VHHDAEDISAGLKSLGFEVVTAIDATKRDMDFALDRFDRLATSADSALFFYAGHAMQFQGGNFLMPTDAMLDEISVRYQWIAMDVVRAALDRTNGGKIMVLDASRNNPLADRLQTTIVGVSAFVPMRRGLPWIDKSQPYPPKTPCNPLAPLATRWHPATWRQCFRCGGIGQEHAAALRVAASPQNAPVTLLRLSRAC
jgi:uncharacterized caspase-like protein